MPAKSAETDAGIYLKDVPFEVAWRRFRTQLELHGLWQPLEAEPVPIDQALDRVTAEPVWAKISSPHYHAAAMDGYAVRAADTAGANDKSPIQLEVPRQAEYVDTGDSLPEWADAVVPVEVAEPVERQGRTAQIALRASTHPWAHIRPLGEDMVATELVLPTGHQMRPVDLGAAAGCGHTQLSVRRRPRVAVIPSGSELVPPGSAPMPGEIIEYNSLVLAAQVISWGGQPQRTPIIPDDLDQIITAVRAAAAASDLVLLNAGSSAGSEDYSARAVESLGDLLVHGVAIRPGHPVILGLIHLEGRAVPIIGVPGYPASAALTGEIFVQPLLRRWLGLGTPPVRTIDAVLTRKVHSSLGDDEYLRVSVGKVSDRIVAAPLARGAGVISSLVRADGIVMIPSGVQGHQAGETVPVRLYRDVAEIERTILIIGSHDLTLDMLGQHLASYGRRLSSASVGSLGGLVALRRQEAHLAGCHLLDPQTGEYNLPDIGRQLPGVPMTVLRFVRRQQGLIVAADNPKQIGGLDDLARPDVRYVNRQRGAGTRVLFDFELQKHGLSARSISGYDNEEYTHLAVSASIAAGRADCGLGIQAAAEALNLGFLPLFSERYDLIVPRQHYLSEHLAPLLEVIRGAAFQNEVTQLAGYEANRMGEVVAELG